MRSMLIPHSVFSVFLFFILLVNLKNFSVSSFLYLDDLSIYLSVLTLLLMNLAVLYATSFNSSFVIFFLVILLEFFLYISFSVPNLLLFFIFFEVSVFPVVLMMFYFGLKPERVLGGSFMFLYTLSGSLPLLLKILLFSYKLSTSDFLNIKYLNFTESTFSFFFSGWFLILFWILGFLMKLPLFGVHHWLPKAHVEAPTMGSMLLAGILLKLGGYGLFRLEGIINLSSSSFVKFLLIWGVFGMIFGCFLCFLNHDLKSMVAYSSVVHMAMIVLLMFNFNSKSFFGGCQVLISHGFMSSLLFMCVGFIYHQTSTRSSVLKKGLLEMCTLFIFFWFFSCSLKMTFPFTPNFFGEVFSLSSVLQFSFFPSLLFLMGILLVGLYKMYLYSLISHGKGYTSLYLNSSSLLFSYFAFLHLLYFFSMMPLLNSCF